MVRISHHSFAYLQLPFLCHCLILGVEAVTNESNKEVSSAIATEYLTCSSVVDFENPHFNISSIPCRNDHICRKNFSIATIDTPPYTNKREVEEFLFACCGECVTSTHVRIFKDTKEMKKGPFQHFDFIFPVLAAETTKRLHGFYYAPFMDAPKAMYIVRKVESNLFEL